MHRNSYWIVSVKDIISPASIPSARRTASFRGNTYVPERLSGKMEVFHFVFPIWASTRIEPKPRLRVVNFSRISEACFLPTYAKNHAPIPGYGTTCERSLYRLIISPPQNQNGT